MSTFQKNFADAIKQLRHELGFSQKDFAQIVDLSPAIISTIESGKGNPSARSVKKILDPLYPKKHSAQ